MRIVIANDDDGHWYVRRIRTVELDLDKDERVYRCDMPLGNDFESLTEACEEALKLMHKGKR